MKGAADKTLTIIDSVPLYYYAINAQNFTAY